MVMELHPIQQVLSEPEWFALLSAKGGKKIYIPKAPTPEHPLAQIVGYEALLRLAEACPGSRELPLRGSAFDRLKAWEEAEKFLSQGWSASQIASRYHISLRTAYRWRKRHNKKLAAS